MNIFSFGIIGFFYGHILIRVLINVVPDSDVDGIDKKKV